MSDLPTDEWWILQMVYLTKVVVPIHLRQLAYITLIKAYCLGIGFPQPSFAKLSYFYYVKTYFDDLTMKN